MRSVRAMVFSITLLLGSPVTADDALNLAGTWRLTGPRNGSGGELAFESTEAGDVRGTYRVFAGSLAKRSNPCLEMMIPVVVERASGEDLILKIDAADVLAGCR